MAGLDIQAKVILGLAKAAIATGNKTQVLTLEKVTTTAGTPLAPGSSTTESIPLVNAIVKNIDNNLADGDSILATDKMIVADGNVKVIQGDKIAINGIINTVVQVIVKNPSNMVLAYNIVVRA